MASVPLYKSQLVKNLSCIDLCSSLGGNIGEAGWTLNDVCAKSNVDARRRVCCACNIVLHRVNYQLVALAQQGILRRNSIMSKIAWFHFSYHKNLLSTIPVTWIGWYPGCPLLASRGWLVSPKRICLAKNPKISSETLTTKYVFLRISRQAWFGKVHYSLVLRGHHRLMFPKVWGDTGTKRCEPGSYIHVLLYISMSR